MLSLVGTSEYRRWECKSERFRRLQIDDQLKFGGLDHRKVERIFSLEHVADIDADYRAGVV